MRGLPTNVARTAGALALAGAGALAYASLIEARWYTLREVTVPVLPAGQDPLRDPAPLRPAPDARAAHEESTGSATSRRSTPTSWSTPATTGPPRGDARRCCDALEPLLARARRVRPRLERLLRADAEEPGALPAARRTRGAPARPARAALARARVAVPLGRLGRPDQPARTSSRSTAVVLSLVGVDDPHLDRDRFPTPAATTARTRIGDRRPAPGRHARALPPGARPDGRGRRRPGPRRAHPRRSARVPFWGALVTNCDLDPGRAKGLHGWPGPGRTDRRPGSRGCTSRPGSAPRRTRPCGSPAARRRRCSRWSPRDAGSGLRGRPGSSAILAGLHGV